MFTPYPPLIYATAPTVFNILYNYNIKCIFQFLDDINMSDNVQFLCREFDSLTYIWMSKNKIDGTQIVVELISHDKLDMHFIEVF
jgi:hypothetical protein